MFLLLLLLVVFLLSKTPKHSSFPPQTKRQTPNNPPPKAKQLKSSSKPWHRRSSLRLVHCCEAAPPAPQWCAVLLLLLLLQQGHPLCVRTPQAMARSWTCPAIQPCPALPCGELLSRQTWSEGDELEKLFCIAHLSTSSTPFIIDVQFTAVWLQLPGQEGEEGGHVDRHCRASSGLKHTPAHKAGRVSVLLS